MTHNILKFPETFIVPVTLAGPIIIALSVEAIVCVPAIVAELTIRPSFNLKVSTAIPLSVVDSAIVLTFIVAARAKSIAPSPSES